ncbi:hypothetical protein BH10ACT11_BH10ACT11_05250 [soil metagenome]
MTTSRRQFLVRGAGLAAATAVPASLLAATPALAASTDETKTLTNLVGLEQSSGLMYATIADKDSLSDETKKLVKQFQVQAQDHVTAFAEALDQLGEDAPDTPTDVADIPELKGLGQASSEADLLDIAIAVEEKLVAGYLAATSDFETEDIIRSGSQVAANHMQHLATLRFIGQGKKVDLDNVIELPQPKEAAGPPSEGDSSSTSSDSTSTSTSTDSSTDSSTSN